jgi:hypothetical protein
MKDHEWHKCENKARERYIMPGNAMEKVMNTGKCHAVVIEHSPGCETRGKGFISRYIKNCEKKMPLAIMALLYRILFVTKKPPEEGFLGLICPI